MVTDENKRQHTSVQDGLPSAADAHALSQRRLLASHHVTTAAFESQQPFTRREAAP